MAGLRQAFSGGRLGGAAVVAGVSLLLTAGLGGGGCVTRFDRHRADLASLHAQGRYDLAAAQLDAERDRYGDRDMLLWWLDRGTAALALGDTQTALEALEEAEARMDIVRESSAADEAAKWLLNDTAAEYIGEPYEDMYVNVFKLLAHLEAGRIDGGATVEARRMAGKADVLRDRYLKLEAAVRKESAQVDSRALSGAAAADTAGRFVESPLGTYLTAVTFMKTGESSLQQVAARRLRTIIGAQRGVIGPVREQDFASLGEIRRGEVNVLAVALSGRGPRKEARRFGPIPVFEWPVYYELPELVGGVAEAAGARLVFDDGTTVPLALVEDLRAVAMENHRRQMPLIQARAIIRSTAKAAASYTLTRVWQANSKRGSEQAIAGLVGTLAGLAFVTITEKADLRCWTLLPAQAHVGLASVQPGERNARIEYLSATGATVFAGPWRTVNIDPRAGDSALVTVIEHWWR
ncbi:MAG: hypothetical protein KF869_08260 [Phycisphaeraceae bacterium]|nr:hypothetical protein [Phycisphaeraceae bacterium]